MTASSASGSLLRTILANAASLTAGRMVLAMLRFAATLIIVQRCGLTLFGEFTLILSFILIAEWFTDFGLGDIAVRQISSGQRPPEATMGAFAFAKLAQALLAVAFLWCVLAAGGRSSLTLNMALATGASLMLYAAVQVFRVAFRVRMQLGRDVGAEIASAAAFLAALHGIPGAGASLETLVACYALSRAVNLAVAAIACGPWPAFRLGLEFREELRLLARAAAPLGASGLVVCLYDAMDAIALAHWSTSDEIGVFGLAMRVMMLAVLVEQAFATAVFPLLSRLWSRDRDAFGRVFQTVLDWGVVAGGAMFCVLYVAAPAVGVLAGRDPHAITAVLRLLSWAVLARVIMTLVGPMVVISGRLHYAVWIQAGIAIAKWCALVALASRGAMGAVVAYLIAEIGVALVPAVVFCQRATGIWLNWTGPAKVIVAAVLIAGSVHLFSLEGGLHEAALALVAFLTFVAVAGAVRPEQLRQLVRDATEFQRAHVR